MASIRSEVPTGRSMKMRDGLIRWVYCAAGLVPWSAAAP